MLISNEWLKDYVDAGVPAKDLAERITRTGIEVADIIAVSYTHLTLPTSDLV